MTDADWSYILAFVVMPIVVVLIGYVAVRVFERYDDRERARERAAGGQSPAE